MDEELNWRGGGQLSRVTEHRTLKENHEKSLSVCVCSLCVCACMCEDTGLYVDLLFLLNIFSTFPLLSEISPLHLSEGSISLFFFFCVLLLSSLSSGQALFIFAAPSVRQRWLLQGVSRQHFNR